MRLDLHHANCTRVTRADSATAPNPTALPQIAFCLVCLAVAANWSKTWYPFKAKSWQVYTMLESINLAIFASSTGALISMFFLLAPRLAPGVAK
jgi:hypothetical protein